MTERVDQMIAALPRGNSLDEAAWNARHQLLLWLLAAHVPALGVVGTLMGRTLPAAAIELLPLLAGLVVGLWAHGRFVRSAGVTMGLVSAAEILVHFTGGLTQVHFHYFVVLGFVALYQDWRPYLLALGLLVGGHAVLGLVLPAGVASGAADPVLRGTLHGAFVLAASAAQIIFWKQTERQQAEAHDYYTRLYEGERAVVAQLRQAQIVKDQLIGIVGHEFRTPLTAIRGFARTLDARFDRMDPDTVQTCTQAIDREAKRLTRMVANLLAASEELRPGDDDRCDLATVVARAVTDVVEIAPTAAEHVRVHVPDEYVVAMTADATGLLLSNLLDNAVKFAAPDTDVRVSARRDGEQVVVEVANTGPPISEADRDRIFDAFVQGDSSDTRRYGGIGVGLHTARRIATTYGGRIAVFCEGPIVIFRVWLPIAGPEVARAPEHRPLARLPVLVPAAHRHTEPAADHNAGVGRP